LKPDVTGRWLADAEWPAWVKLVTESAEGSIYSLPEYLAALGEATGGRFRILGAFRGDELCGGVALYEEATRLGPWVSPRLLLFYNGLVLKSYDTRYPSQRTARQVACLAAMEAALSGAGHAHVALKSRGCFTDARPLLSKGWTARPSYSYVVSLTDLKAQWQRVEQNLRRLVDRCARQGLVLTEDSDFDSFYAMHQATHQRKGAALYLPRDRFRRFVERLRAKGLARLYHARLPEGRSISSQLVLVGHPVTHTVTAGADPEFLNLGATAFLRWKVFEDLAALGYTGNDLTDAPLNSVTHFKSQLGGDLQLCLVVERPDPPAVRAARMASQIRAAAIAGLKRMVGRGPAAEAGRAGGPA
jgi:Acetyltransferase (GNAT) domain